MGATAKKFMQYDDGWVKPPKLQTLRPVVTRSWWDAYCSSHRPGLQRSSLPEVYDDFNSLLFSPSPSFHFTPSTQYSSSTCLPDHLFSFLPQAPNAARTGRQVGSQPIFRLIRRRGKHPVPIQQEQTPDSYTGKKYKQDISNDNGSKNKTKKIPSFLASINHFEF